MSTRSTLNKTPARRQSAGKSPAKGSGTSMAKQQAASPAPASLTAHALLQHYEKIADAPDAIPRLRRFVLDLAVRGKLVEQDPQDEPAEILLQRIAEEKRRLVEAGEIRKKHTQDMQMVPAPSEIPPSWRWMPLGTIFIYDAGAKRDPKALNQSLWLLELEDIEKETGRLLSRMTVAERDSKSTKSQFQVGDILYGKLRPYLNKVIVADQDGYSTTEIVAIRPVVSLCSAFCALVFRAPYFVEYVTRLGQGTKMPRLRTEDAVVAPFPLPPLAEQQRIVAKVDELMTLLDGWEQRRSRISETRTRFTTATLARLTAPEASPAEARQHAQFALKHFPTLTTHPSQITALRQTILNLAVRGKLVPQDPNDEPATELLKRIAEEKKRLVADGSIRRSKPLPPLNEEDCPFDLPRGWCWCRLGDLVLDSDSGWSPQTENHPRVGDAWGVLKVSAVSWDTFDPNANKQVLPGTQPRLQAQVHRGDFLISRANTAELIARAVLVTQQPVNLMMSDKIVRLKLSTECNHHFVHMVNNYANHARSHYATSATGVSPSMKNVSRNAILNLPIPLAPLAEQIRITSTKERLLATITKLDNATTATRHLKSKLAATLCEL